MVTLVDTHRVETLLAINGKMLVDEKYVQTLVEISNLKLVASRKRFDELTLCLDQRLK
jgi:tRNA(Phe) wybutosine-synthesizing methylase Tyw3